MIQSDNSNNTSNNININKSTYFEDDDNIFITVDDDINNISISSNSNQNNSNINSQNNQNNPIFQDLLIKLDRASKEFTNKEKVYPKIQIENKVFNNGFKAKAKYDQLSCRVIKDVDSFRINEELELLTSSSYSFKKFVKLKLNLVLHLLKNQYEDFEISFERVFDINSALSKIEVTNLSGYSNIINNSIGSSSNNNINIISSSSSITTLNSTISTTPNNEISINSDSILSSPNNSQQHQQPSPQQQKFRFRNEIGTQCKETTDTDYFTSQEKYLEKLKESLDYNTKYILDQIKERKKKKVDLVIERMIFIRRNGFYSFVYGGYIRKKSINLTKLSSPFKQNEKCIQKLVNYIYHGRNLLNQEFQILTNFLQINYTNTNINI